MSAIKSFPQDIWIKDVNKLTSGRIASLILKEKLPVFLPEIFSGEIHVKACTKQGWSNISVIVGNSDGKEYIVRIKAKDSSSPDIQNWSPYYKEDFILKAVAGTVPAAETVRNSIGYFRMEGVPRFGSCDLSYWVQTLVPFGDAQNIEKENERLSLMFNIGKAARQLHSIKMPGFGLNFDAEKSNFKENDWATYVTNYIEKLNIDETIKNGFLEKSAVKKIYKRLNALLNIKTDSFLFHHDFVANWSNILVDGNLNIKALIDWEFCGAGAAFQYELASAIYVMHRDKFSSERILKETEAYLDGYGVSSQEYIESFKFDIDTLVITNCLNAINKYVQLKVRDMLHLEPWRKDFFETATRLTHLLA